MLRVAIAVTGEIAVTGGEIRRRTWGWEFQLPGGFRARAWIYPNQPLGPYPQSPCSMRINIKHGILASVPLCSRGSCPWAPRGNPNDFNSQVLLWHWESPHAKRESVPFNLQSVKCLNLLAWFLPLPTLSAASSYVLRL